MEKLAMMLGKRFVPTLGAVLLTGITLTTSVAGVMKVTNSINSAKPKVVEVKTLEEVKKEQAINTVKATSENTNLAKTSNSKTGSITTSKVNTTSTSTPKSTPTSIPTLTPTPTQRPTQQLVVKASTSSPTTPTNGGCIITLFGKQYDVTSLQTSHTGGNIFNCGTDMTTVYQAQHGTDVTRMQSYLVTGNNNSTGTGSAVTGSTGNTGNTTAVGSNKGDDEENDSEDNHDSENNQQQLQQDINNLKKHSGSDHEESYMKQLVNFKLLS